MMIGDRHKSMLPQEAITNLFRAGSRQTMRVWPQRWFGSRVTLVPTQLRVPQHLPGAHIASVLGLRQLPQLKLVSSGLVFSGGVVDLHVRLQVVAVHMEA